MEKQNGNSEDKCKWELMPQDHVCHQIQHKAPSYWELPPLHKEEFVSFNHQGFADVEWNKGLVLSYEFAFPPCCEAARELKLQLSILSQSQTDSVSVQCVIYMYTALCDMLYQDWTQILPLTCMQITHLDICSKLQTWHLQAASFLELLQDMISATMINFFHHCLIKKKCISIFHAVLYFLYVECGYTMDMCIHKFGI